MHSRIQTLGMMLLPWLGVLAVLAILGTVLFPMLLRETDVTVAGQETASLKTFGDSLRSAIVRNGYIPAHTNWTAVVAAEAGLDVAKVATNARRQPRILLIDTNGWFSTVPLPYTQTYSGTTNLPLNARLMIATSLGKALPLTNGPLNASDFSALWNAAEGTTNFPTSGPWAGWNGSSGDVKLERIHLSPLFVSLYLITYSPSNGVPNGQYSIGTNTALYPAPFNSGTQPYTAHYYLQSSILRLYHAPTNSNLDSVQILNRDGSYIYDYADRVWKGSAVGGILPAGVDISGVVSAFISSVPNTSAQNANQQVLVVQAMMNYMSNYNAWASGSTAGGVSFGDNSLRNYLRNTVQPDLMSTVQGLFMGSYYPTNAGTCQ
jgi:type II secretory pathway pseudopilin PulG